MIVYLGCKSIVFIFNLFSLILPPTTNFLREMSLTESVGNRYYVQLTSAFRIGIRVLRFSALERPGGD